MQNDTPELQQQKLQKNIKRFTTEKSRLEARRGSVRRVYKQLESIDLEDKDEDYTDRVEGGIYFADHCLYELERYEKWLNEELEKINWGFEQLELVSEEAAEVLISYMIKDTEISIMHMGWSSKSFDELVRILKDGTIYFEPED